MTRGHLPKAYLRIDPNIDQTHPDNLDGFVRLICAANRQPTRGSFRSQAVLDSLLGKPNVRRLFERGDVAQQPDGTIAVPGWDIWQEGDLTVADRMQRLRDKRRHSGVTAAVTSAVTAAVTLPSPPSKTARQQDSKTVDVLSSERTPRAPAEEPEHGNDPWEQSEAEAVDWLRAHKCTIREGDGYHQRLITGVERHGVNAIVGQFDRLARAGTQDGDIKGFLFAAIDLLDARGRPNLHELEAEERREEQEEAFDKRVARTLEENRRRFPGLSPEGGTA